MQDVGVTRHSAQTSSLRALLGSRQACEGAAKGSHHTPWSTSCHMLIVAVDGLCHVALTPADAGKPGISTVVADCAGKYLPDKAWLLMVMQAVLRYCGASPSLTVDLFCGGALGALVRIAQRAVAALPHAAQYGYARQAVEDFLAPLVKAFALAVPQARAVVCYLSSLCVISDGMAGTEGAS